MTRQEAAKTIKDLYGLDPDYVQEAIEKFDEAALSDQALVFIAESQLARERRRGDQIERVARYKDSHPGLSWEECEENLRLGIH